MRLAVHHLNANCFMLPISAGIPFTENPSDSTVNSPSSFSSEIKQKKLVLILSKEPDTRFLFKTLLELWDYSVETAENFEDLISTAERAHPSLILMDTALPFDDNISKMKRMRESEIFNQLPIVLISGHAQPQFRTLALAVGADDFLVKPVDFDLLEDCLKRNINKDKKTQTELL